MSAPGRGGAGGPAAAFLNADLDVVSAEDLAPLAAALEPAAFALHVERGGGECRAAFELNGSDSPLDPDSTVAALARAVLALPASPRALWDRTTLRRVSIGLRAGPGCETFAAELRPETLRLLAGINASLEVVVYGGG